MALTDFYATHRAKRHMLEKHAVEWEEVAQVLWQEPPIRKVAVVRGERRYWMVGRTDSGRRLKPIVAAEPAGLMRVITAFEVRK